jgi:hypothetical protein
MHARPEIRDILIAKKKDEALDHDRPVQVY